MKLLLLVLFCCFLVVGSAFPLWLPVKAPFPQAQLGGATPNSTGSGATTYPVALIGFVSTPVAASVTGVIIELYFYEGQFVRKGQVLAKLWVRAANAPEYVSAPKEGIITHRYALIRTQWPAAKPLLTLADPTQVRVRLAPSLLAALHLRPNDSVYVRLAASPAVAVRGKVLHLGSAEDASLTATLQLAKPVVGATTGAALFITPIRVPRQAVTKLSRDQALLHTSGTKSL
jgi:hypothetical protein